MIYIIISNIGLAVMMVLIYFRYSHFRITSTFKIRDLEKRLAREIADKESISTGLTNEVKTEVEQVKKLLRAIDELRKEKEEEARLRLEAEKQIELALQKTQEVQKRMNDWKNLQDAAMNEAKNAIFKVGDELFSKIEKTQKQESEQSRAALDQTAKSVYSYLDNIAKNVEAFKHKSDLAGDKFDKAVSVAGSSIIKAAPIQLDDATKKMIDNVIENIKISGHELNKVYTTAAALSAEKARMFLCDLVFAKEGVLYIFDFKSLRYFYEYNKSKNSDKAVATNYLKQRLDKYLAYISNAKYEAAIRKVALSLKIKFSETKIVFVAGSRSEITVLKEIKYVDKIKELGVEIYDVDQVNDLVL